MIEARFAKSIRFKVVPAVVEKAVKGADAEVSVLPEKRILVPKEKISPRMNNPRTVINIILMECYRWFGRFVLLNLMSAFHVSAFLF